MSLDLAFWVVAGAAGFVALLCYAIYRFHPCPLMQWRMGYGALISAALTLALLLSAFVQWWLHHRTFVALGAGLILSLLVAFTSIAHALRREYRLLNG